MGAEARRDRAQRLRRIAFRIDGDQHRRNSSPRLAEQIDRRRHVLQAQGTDAGAVRIAEEQQHVAAAKVRVGNAPALGIGQRERPAQFDRQCRPRRRLR